LVKLCRPLPYDIKAKTRLNILLTHSYFLNEDPKEKVIMKPYVPLGILYISAYLEEHGFDNTVFDSTFQSFEEQQAFIIKEKPDVLAVYTNLMTKLNVVKLVKWVRTQKELNQTKILLGGPEVTHHAFDFLKIGVDVIIVGEGEQTMLDVVKAISVKSDISLIEGICFLDAKKELVKTKERQLIKDINTLPFPNRKKIDFSLYLETWKTHHGSSMMSVNTMRGCPYTCKWCSRAVYGGTYRRRKPELVVEELLYLKQNYQPDMIWFVDDVFTIHHKWLKEFSELVQAKKAVIPYEIISRADRLNEDVLKLLKASGCSRIWIGAESGSQRIIDAMDRRVDVMETRKMIRLAKQIGITTGTFIMLGYPGETKADIQQTIDHLVESNPDFYTSTITYPIKGTPLYKQVEADFLTPYHFETNTDRDLDFKRGHTRRYYEHALRWLQLEVYRQTKVKNPVKNAYLKLKSVYLQGKMALEGGQ
jgi:anaerobic magnesium-protoporphyrin IX monomethyl ester cyclase